MIKEYTNESGNIMPVEKFIAQKLDEGAKSVTVADIMAMFAALDLDAKEAFFEFGAQTAYYDALEAYFNAQLSAEIADTEIVRAILNAQIYNIALSMDNNDENVASFSEYMSQAIDKYEALSESDTLPTELDDLYNELLTVYGGVVN